MTVVRFSYLDGNIIGFEVSGHSTENANDLNGKLVCASVSSAVYMAVNTLTEIQHLDVDAAVSDGKMSAKVMNNAEKAQVVLSGLLLHLTELSKDYPKNITIYSEV